MGLEAATFVNDLVITNPVGASDDVRFGDDHIRLIKSALKTTFPDASQVLRPSLLLATQAAAPSTVLAFTGIGVNDTRWKSFEFQLENLLPAVDSADFWLQVSADNGATYITTASYAHVRQAFQVGSPNFGSGSGGNDTKVSLLDSQGNTSGFVANGSIRFHVASATFHWQIGYVSVVDYTVVNGYGRRVGSINAVRFLYSAGDIASGSIRCYGHI